MTTAAEYNALADDVRDRTWGDPEIVEALREAAKLAERLARAETVIARARTLHDESTGGDLLDFMRKLGAILDYVELHETEGA